MKNYKEESQSKKRYHGEFYTPILFAEKSFLYIEDVLGKDFLSTGKYRIWDMSCGEGNLLLSIKKEYQKYIYMSTLCEKDVEYCREKFTGSLSFQYDYLNDDASNVFNNINLDDDSWKMPLDMRRDMLDKNIKWLIFINPPFATSQSAGANSMSKKDISKTKIRDYMHDSRLGDMSRELYAQFLFRISNEFNGLDTTLALFSKTNYLNSGNSQKFRENIFNYLFKKGFVFSSGNFLGTSKATAFSVSFIIWDLNSKQSLYNQDIALDVLDDNTNKTSEKKIKTIDKKYFLNNWIERKKCSMIFPPLSSAIKIKESGNDIRNKICEGFIGSFMCCGNDVIKQGFTAILSAPQACAGSLSITTDLFEHVMIIHAVRRIVKCDWLNSTDQFIIPQKDIDEHSINDFIIWSLFANSNQTSSIKDVFYINQMYQIKNNFFPFGLDEIKTWDISKKTIIESMSNDSDRFVYTYLINKKLSAEAYALVEIARKLYRYFFENIDKLDTAKFKIDNWDVGYWQIRKSTSDKKLGKDILDELKYLHTDLGAKLREKIYDFQFL